MEEQPQYRVLQITTKPFPPAIRVLKEAKTFRDAGYTSAVMCPPMAGRPAREEWNGITIFRPPTLVAAESVLDKVLYQSTFFSFAWRRAIEAVIGEYQPHVLHMHDIWIADSVFRARKRTREKVVIDLHENMPAAVDEYLKGYRGVQKIFNWMVKPRTRVLRHERRVLEKSDMALVVVQEAASRVQAEHPVLDRSKVVVVENLESKDFLVAPVEHAAVPPAQSDASVLYIGGFGPHRGIDTLIHAMVHLKAWGMPVRLDLVGAQSKSTYVEMIRELITALDLWSHVNLVDWVPSDAVLAFIRRATIGVVPHHSNPHTDNTIPHKLYQYMIAAKAVLVSTSAPLARTVWAANSGAVFQAGDPLDCAEKIRDLLADPNKRKLFGQNGYNYVMRDGNSWEDQSAPQLLNAYGTLMRGPDVPIISA